MAYFLQRHRSGLYSIIDQYHIQSNNARNHMHTTATSLIRGLRPITAIHISHFAFQLQNLTENRKLLLLGLHKGEFKGSDFRYPVTQSFPAYWGKIFGIVGEAVPWESNPSAACRRSRKLPVRGSTSATTLLDISCLLQAHASFLSSHLRTK